VSANFKTILWALHADRGSCFWRHDRGFPGRVAHPAAHLQQVEIDRHSAAVSGSTSTASRGPRRPVGLAKVSGGARDFADRVENLTD
jgi:hypothetical protein